jgi:hypothetical protein
VRATSWGRLLAGASRGRLAVAVGILGTLALVLLDALVPDEPRPRGDDLIYERMAEDPLAPHTFPFGYRLLVPALVHVLPFGHTLSFSLISWLASGAAGAVVVLLLTRLGSAPGVAAALGLLLAVSPPLLVVAVRQGRSTDAVTILVMLVATLLMVERRRGWLAATLVAGALTRESAMFLIPLAYALWARRPVDLRALGQVAAVALPAVAVYVALRLGVETVGREQVPGYGAPLLQGRLDVLAAGLREWPTQARRLVTAFGPLWLVAPLALGGMAFARRGLVLVALCLVAMTFALDWGRIAFLAAPVVYPAAGWALTRRASPRLRVLTILGFAVLSAVYAYHLAHGGVQHGIVEQGPPPYPVQ